MSDVARAQEASGRPVYTIQWHVDYWNYLGYRDPFSHPDHARRQRAYARAAGRRGVFTPHVLVNGETLRPVSAARLRSAIDDAIDESRPRAARIVRFDYDASASRLQYETTDAGDVALARFADPLGCCLQWLLRHGAVVGVGMKQGRGVRHDAHMAFP
ncbi:MAG: DUF1223 domain-containing protein, partial [Myxococcota bacterium]